MSEWQDKLVEAVGVLCKANARLDAAEKGYSAANKEYTSALNTVNAAQKEVSKIMDAVKQAAPRGSDWCKK